MPFPFSVDGHVEGYRKELLPSVDEIWDLQVAMNNIGPNKYTGNKAHKDYVEFLATNLKSLGLDVQRDQYTLPRWEATSWGLEVKPSSGAAFEVPVTSYYPYSGQTGKEGVTGELVTMEYVRAANVSPQQPEEFHIPFDVKGKIVLIECPIRPSFNAKVDRVWNVYTEGTELLPDVRAVNGRGAAPPLDAFKKAGAVGLVLAWTNISDEQAADQYVPFGRALQDFPTIYVGKKSGASLKAVAGTGAKATLRLEANVFPDTATDTLIGTLPGATDDEIVIVNSHTDGPNAIEENGGIGIVALARYFSKLPKSDRKRTLVFPLTTGHFAHAYVPSIAGFVKQHPDLVKKAVASITVEHLGCQEWLDDASGRYAYTGKAELSFCFTGNEGIADVMLEGVTGTGDKRVAIFKGRGPGEGGALMAAGVPTIGYIAIPSYLLTGASNGCIEKVDRNLLHSQIEGFAKVVHQMESMSAADLKQGYWNVGG
jgi:PA domain